MFEPTRSWPVGGAVPGLGRPRGRNGGLGDASELVPPVPAALPYTVPLAGPFGALLVLAMVLAGLG